VRHPPELIFITHESFLLQDIFIRWPSPDDRLDIAVIPRDHPASASQSQTNPICPDSTDIQSCVEHTVISGSYGYKHNKQHAYANINELLKCPMNISFIALGIHGSGMTLWYADRCGIIEVDLGTNKSLQIQAVRGLSNASPLRDPCVSVHSLEPRRIYEFRLHANIYYGLYGSQGEPLYSADGIACRGTLVLTGFRTTAHASEMLAIKLSYPSVHTAGTWVFEWQILQSLKTCGVRNVPELIDHIEHNVSTNSVREAVGLQDNRIRAILITQPIAQITLQAIENDIELSMLVQVMKDVIDGTSPALQVTE
jgi:Fungal protein kinase